MNNSSSNKPGTPAPVVDLTTLRLTAKLIPIIAPFMAKNDIRYYLTAVNVRPHKDGGAVICATNGHALGIIYDRNAICSAEVTLRMDARLLQACASGLSKERIVKAFNGRLVVSEEVGGGEAYIQPGCPIVQCDYPRYDRVVPKPEKMQPGLIGSFSCHLLRLADMAASAAAKANGSNVKHNNAIQFYNSEGDSNASAVFRLVANDDFVGVLMPMRCDAIIPAIPEWVAHMPKVDDLAGMGAAA